MLVLGNNYLVMFVGWEGVGLCSYLLIGFYYDQPFPPYAGKKAFIVNRIGDFAFLVGMFALFAQLRQPRPTATLAEDRRRPGARDSRHLRAGAAARQLRRPLLLHRRHGQERADPALRLAAGRDGRPDAGLRPDPRRDHGHRRRLHGGALERDLSARARGARCSWRSSARRRRSSRPRSASPRPTSRRCSPTRPSRSSATCSWPRASAPTRRRSSTS